MASLALLTLRNTDDPSQIIDLRVDFGASAWSVSSSPKQVKLSAADGRIATAQVGTTSVTDLKQKDNSTAVGQLFEFGPSSKASDRGEGILFLVDQPDGITVSWTVDTVK